ncbi:hypothetical protein [Bacillus sp. AFS031507]|uniref:hypothetical protein n=1 Tax=Bacillus sp. AFS031507 TaxID=2033496 RepID=UPI000BFD62A7|nr:hypothetical protein [Bacillus sp. AFS031507]PGY11063.1 hypothetical protein COE25_15025 [Bacillus sp. AFS031507]
MSGGSGILMAIDAASGSMDAIDKFKKIFNDIDAARSVILEIDNHTDQTLIKLAEHHFDGGWSVTPQGEIPPNYALIFGSKDKDFMTGTEGSITYAAEGIEFEVYWNNPFIGDNECKINLNGPNADQYRVNKECGIGDTDAHMRFELFTNP